MKHLLISTAIIAATAVPVLAATDAKSLTDLNLRAGPGVQHEITGVIASGDAVSVEGCISSVDWCKVAYNGQTGWAYGPYLSATSGSEEITLAPAPARQTVVAEVKDDSGVAAIGGASVGALIAAAAAAGPVGIAAAGIAGAALADATTGPEIQTYVKSNPVDPVYLDGEVVVGAGIPDTVKLYPVPDFEVVVPLRERRAGHRPTRRPQDRHHCALTREPNRVAQRAVPSGAARFVFPCRPGCELPGPVSSLAHGNRARLQDMEKHDENAVCFHRRRNAACSPRLRPDRRRRN